mgnify:CR=1 FL=1
MKVRTVIPNDFATLFRKEIMPNGCEWDAGNGCIAVHFFEIDGEGKIKFAPTVRVNVSLVGKLSSEEAKGWGECLMLAAQTINQVDENDAFGYIKVLERRRENESTELK